MKSLKNKTELRNFILNSEGNTDSLKVIHFFEEDSKITWEIWGCNEAVNSGATETVKVGRMDSTRETSSKKDRNIAITNSFQEIENGNYELY